MAQAQSAHSCSRDRAIIASVEKSMLITDGSDLGIHCSPVELWALFFALPRIYVILVNSFIPSGLFYYNTLERSISYNRLLVVFYYDYVL